jgi:hypothetical protein
MKPAKWPSYGSLHVGASRNWVFHSRRPFIRGRQTLKECGFWVTEGTAGNEDAEGWCSSVPRVICLLQVGQRVEFNVGLQSSVGSNGEDVTG